MEMIPCWGRVLGPSNNTPFRISKNIPSDWYLRFWVNQSHDMKWTEWRKLKEN